MSKKIENKKPKWASKDDMHIPKEKELVDKYGFPVIKKKTKSKSSELIDILEKKAGLVQSTKDVIKLFDMFNDGMKKNLNLVNKEKKSKPIPFAPKAIKLPKFYDKDAPDEDDDIGIYDKVAQPKKNKSKVKKIKKKPLNRFEMMDFDDEFFVGD